jgi:hypothetical protein
VDQFIDFLGFALTQKFGTVLGYLFGQLDEIATGRLGAGSGLHPGANDKENQQ